MKVVVHCETHNVILDEGEIGSDSGLILWNDFTTAKKHLNCFVVLRLRENVPKFTKVERRNGKVEKQ